MTHRKTISLSFHCSKTVSDISIITNLLYINIYFWDIFIMIGILGSWQRENSFIKYEVDEILRVKLDYDWHEAVYRFLRSCTCAVNGSYSLNSLPWWLLGKNLCTITVSIIVFYLQDILKLMRWLRVRCLDVLVDPVDNGVDISDDDGDGVSIAELVSITSVGHQTVQDVALGKGVAKVVLKQLKSKFSLTNIY